MWSKRTEWVSDHFSTPLPSTRRNRSNTRCAPRKFLAVSAVALALTIDVVPVAGEYSDSDSFSSSTTYTDDAEERKRVHDIIVEEWYDLVRYLVGLGLCIFGLIGMYFHQFASYYFVKKYSRPRETEHRIGTVLSCEPLGRNTSSRTISSKEKSNKNGKKAQITASVLPISKIGIKAQGDSGYPTSSIITEYVREEDIEQGQQLGTGTKCTKSNQQRQQQQQQQQHTSSTEYHMLVVYNVQKERSTSLFCCSNDCNSNSNCDDLGISCAHSFSANSFAPDRLDNIDINIEPIDAYRSRSLPLKFKDCNNFDRIVHTNYIPRNDDTEYFRWFQTSTPKSIDADIDLILLKGHPRSACTPELIETHLEQVGIRSRKESDKRKYYKSISMLGLALVVTIIVFAFVCVIEVLSMPNPESQRPIGFTILGAHLVLSIAGAYIFAKWRFEQYKQEVFLSAFAVPCYTKSRDTDTNNDVGAGVGSMM
eukprot:CAMPEP_0168232060 /NCGR_PEP_ID=MMETSP0140_2-20121125/16929_1 /TAXON_ID=44445 /ORGANISM="Pseudo-nitzschia australis, Strain 10249 10 AB" /LENGTH=479 /DNA_ID=CAMNT_0008164557 /DNA_START=143 /DNA_END=1582 /DNA_ORIENTATION=+